MSDSPRPLRVGLLGYGLAGRVFHAPLIAACPDLVLAAVVTRDPERRAAMRAVHPETEPLDTPEQLWARAGSLDVAVVATANRSHAPLARAALQAGLAVVVDKPITPTATEARALIDDARAAGRLLTVFQNRRWDGDFLTVRKLIADGALGAVHRFESRFERWNPVVRPGWRESGDPAEAGGLLLDLGPHLVDQAVQLFGPVRTVYGEVDRRRHGVVTDDDAFIALGHASGVRSHLWASKVAAQRAPRFRVLGERAAFVKYGLDSQEPAMAVGVIPGSPGWGEEPADRWGFLGEEGTAQPVATVPGAYPWFYKALAAAVRGDGPLPVDPADTVNTLDILEAARASAEHGRVVQLRAG
ncbi:MAG TPA: Gfo/Idh/MocA family oxidoreductase [Kofleriaceae bacterium]|jgi:predicted dehydrogenase|nr:Gfo/Idh/MocA family oxidoreductase [Kofleriaceae bacterium]